MNTNVPDQREKTLAPYVFVEQAFTMEECDRVMELGRREALHPGNVSGKDPNSDIRDSSITLLNARPDTQWLYERVVGIANHFNMRLWMFDLFGSEPMQFAAYGPEQRYNWHVDLWASKPRNTRKLSISIQLSEPESYEGGDFEIAQTGTDNAIGPRNRGAAILFPSYVLHRVQPVTRGTRYSLVTWVVGQTGFR